jgi:nucleotide-binding universal stress UspA family protein
MLQKMLVPLDGSALAEQALNYATELSIPTGATLLLVRAAYSHALPGVDPREQKHGAPGEAERGYACDTVVPGAPSVT